MTKGPIDKAALALVVFGAAFCLSFWIAAGYVAVHFAEKFW